MSLPETPLGLKELKKLDVCHNQIDCIPEKFLHTCSKLEVIEASFNHISEYQIIQSLVVLHIFWLQNKRADQLKKSKLFRE